MKRLFLFASTVVFAAGVAQNKDVRIPNYNKVPYWIEMIKNPNVNYYDAVTAYEEFWKGRKNPLQESTLLAEDTSRPNAVKETPADKRDRILYLKYVAECRKFECWRSSVRPLVQPDGHIMSGKN